MKVVKPVVAEEAKSKVEAVKPQVKKEEKQTEPEEIKKVEASSEIVEAL